MYVTQHARTRIASRLGEGVADGYVEVLEQRYSGEYGTVAYLFRLPASVRADDGSNGDVLVVIAVDGSVETVYFRRADQDLSPAYFGARKVYDLRTEARYEEDEDEYRVKGEARTARVDNRRKMKVTGRSTLLLSALASGQQQRRRVRRRKVGAR